MSEEVENYKRLLSKAHSEIEGLREKIGTCSTTILNTVMAQEAQETEVKFLRARCTELEKIIAQSDKIAEGAVDVISTMQGAMNRMQATILKVAGEANQTLGIIEIKEQIDELERTAQSTSLNASEIAAYQAQIASLKAKAGKV